jgi:hypothetical protein
MGRSQGRRRNLAQGLINDRVSISSFNRGDRRAITDSLRSKITEQIYDQTNRDSLYIDLGKDLKEELLQISPNLLKKDPTIKKLINFEVEEVFKESGVDVSGHNLGHLVESFLNDLDNQETPNLGRGLLNDLNTPTDLKKEIVNGYLSKLRSLKNNQDDYLDFLLTSCLPLGARKNNRDLFQGFAQEAVFYLIKEPVLKDALPSIENEGDLLAQEKLSASVALTEYLIKNYNQDIDKEDIYNQIATAQGKIITNHIFALLSQEEGPLKSDLLIASYDDQGKIDYLDEAIEKSADKNFSKEIILKVYQLFGGKTTDFTGSAKSLKGEDIFNLISNQAKQGAFIQIQYPGKYNFQANLARGVALITMRI